MLFPELYGTWNLISRDGIVSRATKILYILWEPAVAWALYVMKVLVLESI
jgi:hypothetical protein